MNPFRLPAHDLARPPRRERHVTIDGVAIIVSDPLLAEQVRACPTWNSRETRDDVKPRCRCTRCVRLRGEP